MSAMFEFSVCACQIYIDIFLYIFFQSLIQSGQGKIKGKIKKEQLRKKTCLLCKSHLSLYKIHFLRGLHARVHACCEREDEREVYMRGSGGSGCWIC